jgi:hypothetical protein
VGDACDPKQYRAISMDELLNAPLSIELLPLSATIDR